MDIDILGFWGGYPKDGEATSGYLLTVNDKKILLDCGSGIYSKFSLKNKVQDISAIIISHLHFDHMADVGIVQYAMVGALRNGYAKEKLPILAPSEPNTIRELIYSNESEMIEIDKLASTKMFGIEISFCKVSHTIPTYAVKLEYDGKIFVYSADTSYDERLIEFAKNADLFICEATVCEGSKHTTGVGHMNAKEAATIAKNANVKQLVLTHLPHDGDFVKMKQQAQEVFGENVVMAYEQSKFSLYK